MSETLAQISTMCICVCWTGYMCWSWDMTGCHVSLGACCGWSGQVPGEASCWGGTGGGWNAHTHHSAEDFQAVSSRLIGPVISSPEPCLCFTCRVWDVNKQGKARERGGECQKECEVCVVWRVVSGLHGVSQVRQSRCSGVFNDRDYNSEQEDGYQLGMLDEQEVSVTVVCGFNLSSSPSPQEPLSVLTLVWTYI